VPSIRLVKDASIEWAASKRERLGARCNKDRPLQHY
jgi:hypothetical protein